MASLAIKPISIDFSLWFYLIFFSRRVEEDDSLLDNQSMEDLMLSTENNEESFDIGRRLYLDEPLGRKL